MANALTQWDAITDHILIGTCPMVTTDIDHIQSQTGCEAILCLQSDEDLRAFDIDWYELQEHAEGRGLSMTRVPMRDFDPADQVKALGEAVHCLGRLLAKGARVYVHCTAGINRGPLVVLGYLTFISGLSFDDAKATLLRGRASAAPPVEVWREARQALLDPREDEVARLSAELAADASFHGDCEAEAERRVLRRILAPA